MTLLKTVSGFMALTLCAQAEVVEIDARGGVIPNSANAEVRITSATGSGNYITLATNAGSTVSVMSLRQVQSAVPAMVQIFSSQCLKLSGVGIDGGAGDLTIGDMPSEGALAATGAGVTFDPVDVSANLTLNAVFTNAAKVAKKTGGGTVSAVGEFRASVDQTEGVMAYAIPSLIANAQMPYMTISGAGLIYDFDSEGMMDGFGGSGSSVVGSGKEAYVSTTDRKVAVPLRGFNVNGRTVAVLQNVTAYQPEVVEAAEYGEADTPDGFEVGVGSEGVLKLDGGSLSSKLTVGSGSGGRGALIIDGGAVVTNYCSMTNRECLFAPNGYASVEVRNGRYVAGGLWGSASGGVCCMTVMNGTLLHTAKAFRESGVYLGASGGYASLTVGENGVFDASDSAHGVEMPLAGTEMSVNRVQVTVENGGVLDAGPNQLNASGRTVFNLNDGGVIRAAGIASGDSSGTVIQFNGGTFAATANSASLFDGRVIAYEKGATIDVPAGLNVTIDNSSPIVGASGNGIVSIRVPSAWAERKFIGPPFVDLSWSPGTGASGVCEIDRTTGGLNAIRVTGHGTGYMGYATGALRYGSEYVSIAASDCEVTNNVSGGLTKTGEGVLTVKSVNTYTGDTRIAGGEVVLNGAGAFSPESGLYLSGNGVLDLGGGEVTFSNFGGDGSGSVVNGTLHLSGLVFDLEKVKAGEIETLNFSSNIVFDISAGVRLLNADEMQLSRGNEYTLCKMTGEVPDRLPPIDAETYQNLSKPWGIQIRLNEQGEYVAVLRYFGGSLFIYY